MYLLDTNAIINFLDASLPASAIQSLNNVVDEQSNVSIITKMEALGFNFKTAVDQAIMEEFVTGSNVLGITDEIADRTILIRKSRKMHLPDAIIAATALVHNLILVTSNNADFRNIPGLQVIDPHAL